MRGIVGEGGCGGLSSGVEHSEVAGVELVENMISAGKRVQRVWRQLGRVYLISCGQYVKLLGEHVRACCWPGLMASWLGPKERGALHCGHQHEGCC